MLLNQAHSRSDKAEAFWNQSKTAEHRFFAFQPLFTQQYYTLSERQKEGKGQKGRMCHASVASAGNQGLAMRHRWLVFQASMMAAAHRSPRTGVARETGGAGFTIKRCLCSPTKHPGSFRCRHHHAEYVWGGRVVSKK